MVITRTPYRVSLAGGGTDFPEFFREGQSLIVSLPLKKYFYINITPRFTGNLRVSYSKTENVQSSEELRHEIARVILDRYHLRSGLEIAMIGEVPGGSGLASSSAVTVGLLHAVRQSLGLASTAKALAAEAVIVETELLKKPIGWQDQYGVAFPGLKSICLGPGDAVQVERLELPAENRAALERNSLLVFTGGTREAAAVLTEQQSKVAANVAGLQAVLGIAKDMLAAFRNPRLDLPLLGSMLNETWRIKQTLANNITSSKIDELYDLGIEAGAWGGKLLGAGQGGFLLFLIAEECQARMLARMGNPRTMPLTIDSTGSSIVFDSGERLRTG